MKSLSAGITRTETKHDEFLRCYENLHNSYIQLQEPDALGRIDLATSDKLEEIEKLAEGYPISEQGQTLIPQCA